MAGFSDDDIIELKGQILWSNLDSAKSAFRTTGAASSRTDQTAERIITRAINAANGTSVIALSTANGFKDRFDSVIGDEEISDRERILKMQEKKAELADIALDGSGDPFEKLSRDEFLALLDA